MDIRELVARRTDLSTFLVHLTRDQPGVVAGSALRSILTTGQIEARSVFGSARTRLEEQGCAPMSQRCVCFTETPLELRARRLVERLGGDVSDALWGGRVSWSRSPRGMRRRTFDRLCASYGAVLDERNGLLRARLNCLRAKRVA
jgi:hypothetical protein